MTISRSNISASPSDPPHLGRASPSVDTGRRLRRRIPLHRPNTAIAEVAREELAKCDGPPASWSSIDVRSDDPGRHPGRRKCTDLNRRIAGVVDNYDPLRRIRLRRNGVETTGERLGRIVAEHKGHDLAPATVFHRPPIVDSFGIMQAGQGADAISGRRLSAHPVISDGGALSDCGSSWTLADRGMDFLFGPPFGPQLAPVLTSESREYVIMRRDLRIGEGWGR